MKIRYKAMLLISAAACFLTSTNPVQAKTSTCSPGQAKQLKQVLRENKANAVIIVNGKSSRHPTIIHNEIKVNGHRAKPVSVNKLFPIASFQKSVTGFAVQKLLNQHDLTLKTKLSKYISGVPNGGQITVLHLLTHTSSIADASNMAEHVLRSQAQLRHFTIKNSQTGPAALGQWHYANSNYGLLAIIIGRVSHQSYYHYMRSHIFKPYHLKKVAFFPNLSLHSKLTPSINVRYSKDKQEQGHPWTYLRREMASEYGAGDLLCAPITYWQFINQEILNHPHLLVTYYYRAKHSDNNYYAGFYVHPGQIHTNGSYDGYSCTMYSNYHTKRTLMVFSNNLSHKQMRKLGPQLYRVYFGNQKGFAY